MAPTLLILSPLKSVSGNLSTAERLREHLVSSGYPCEIADPKSFTSKDSFHTSLSYHKISALLAIHAFKSGQLIADCGLPYALIYGGTDINVQSQNPDALPLMTTAVQQAKFLVGFSKSVIEKASTIWPNIVEEKTHLIPQAIKTCPSDFCFHGFLQGTYCEGITTTSKLFTLVAGIRPVKDPLYLVKAFSDWHLSQERDVFLVIIGPNADEVYSQQFRKIVTSSPGVIHVPGLSNADTHAAIRDSFALVNSSVSEGMSAAILEALDLGTPVIARNIPGNAAVIQHGVTGMLYDTTLDFLEVARQILSNPKLVEKLTVNGLRLAQENHSCEIEKHAYRKIVESLLS